jgi:hypothetical protein
MLMKSKLIKCVASLVFIVVTFGNSYCQTSYSSSIVRLYGNNSAGATFKGGTGSFVKIAGSPYILTCYHVINGTQSIDAHANSGKIEHVSVVAYDRVKDIALLSFKSDGVPKCLQLGAIPSGLTNYTATAIGQPNGIPQQVFNVHFTSEEGEIPAMTLQDAHGNGIFNGAGQGFKIIPVDLTIYGGMSGAPVILNGFVIGILSGSLNPGGSLGWAIPAHYCSEMSIHQPGSISSISLGDVTSLNYPSVLRSGNFDDGLTQTYSPIDDNFKDIEDGTAGFIASLNSLSSKLSALNDHLESFNPANAPPGSDELQYINSLMDDYNSMVPNASTINNKLQADINTFAALVDQITNYNGQNNATYEQQINADDLARLKSNISSYNFKCTQIATNRNNATQQKDMPNMLCEAQRAYNANVVAGDCKNSYSISVSEIKYAIQFATAELTYLRYEKNYIDLLYEAKNYGNN